MASPSRTRRRQTLRQLLRCPDCRSSSRLGAAPGPVGLDLMAQFVDAINSNVTPCAHVELAANGDVSSVLGQDDGIAFWVAAHPTRVRCWACTLALGRQTVCDHCHSPAPLRDRPMALGPRLVMLARLCAGCSRGWRRQDGDAP